MNLKHFIFKHLLSICEISVSVVCLQVVVSGGVKARVELG